MVAFVSELKDLLTVAFLALGCAWLAVDLARKLRAPAREVPLPAPLPAATSPVVAPALASVPAPAQPPATTEDTSHHLTVIAATIHHLFRGRARILGMTPAAVASQASADWAREGRRDVLHSHRVR